MPDLLEPLRHAFMVRGLIAATIVGVTCAAVGSFVVLRGMAFYGGALAHAILPGVAIGYLVHGSATGELFWWGLGAAVISALAIGAITQGGRLREDTAIGIIFPGMFALGIALISSARSFSVDLTHFLFGNVLGVSTTHLLLTGAFALLILILLFALYKEFLLLSFDPVLARTLRLPHRALDALLMILIALTIVVSLQTVGIALMAAMLVTPAAAAQLLARRMGSMIGLAILFAVGSGVVGLYLSFYVRVSSGAAIVLVATALFGLAWLLASLRRAS